MSEIDLSKYAAGKRLKCADAGHFSLTNGQEYDSGGHIKIGGIDYVRVDDGCGDLTPFSLSRFVPVEDEAPKRRPCPDGSHSFAVVSDVCRKCNMSRNEVIQFGRSDSIVVPALSPGQAIREPVRLNEAQREAVRIHAGPTAAEVREAYVKPDPYEQHRLSVGKRVRLGGPGESLENRIAVEQSSADIMSGRREKLIAALRRELDDGSRMKAFPKEGRSDRVYRENDR